ncbi:MAG: 2OG-Fe(II) oxygenase, partial [Nannocystaceae bacterium]|nr:2OG-Fe(II) oxygenase [Nannocystaceae bacterium]
MQPNKPAARDEAGGIRTLPAALSPQECREWIARFEVAGYASMAHRYPPGYRNNHRAVLDSGELAGTLAERFADLFPATWHDKSGQRWTFSGLNTRFRACRYAAGESFGIHRDGAQARGECRTFLTVMLYLNDASGFGGGATHFYTSKARTERLATVTPREGLAIVFPHELWHEGEEVRSGHKYVLRTDVVYQRPRPEQDAPGHRGYVWDAATLPGGGAVTVGRDGNIIHWSDALAVRPVSYTHLTLPT